MAFTKKKTETVTTTSQQLGSLIKSCRDIMRKDKGLNGDLDRLPMLTWVLFLKFLDDLEQLREAEAELEGKRFHSAIEAPYRWRDWAAQPDGITGDALIAFINQDEATRPDGTRGPGLFATLRSLTGGEGTDRRDVIRAVFTGTANRMLNGYLLRDMVNKVQGIHFTSSQEISTLGHLYESMLKEMRDAAGDSGEFYTPRALVKFIVAVTDPRLGETVLDPACGTGGFLTESFEHLKKQCRTTEDHYRLQCETLSGVEAKPLPYLLCQMNLLLHGLESPQIDPLNALRHKLGEIGDKDRVDVIMTNPPFGGEEQRGILGNFPADKQTAETALLFLQLIMRKLRRQPKPGRAAVVVPNGTLFGDGICARIKEELLRDFNLHTIVRLPNGVFSPYTPIRTNVLFFDRSGPTKDVWYYEQPLPEGRKNYTKTAPLQFEEFANCTTWWTKREANAQAWVVSAKQIVANGYNLDISNPSGKQNLEHLPPQQLVDELLEKQMQIVHVVQGFRQGKLPELDKLPSPGTYRTVHMGEIATLVKRPAQTDGDFVVRSLGVKLWGKGVHVAEEKAASELRADRFVVCGNDLIYNDMWARHGSVAIVPPGLEGCVASAHFPTWELDLDKVYPPFFAWCFRSPWFWKACENRSQGSTGRNAISKTEFRNLVMPLPTMAEQVDIVAYLNCVQTAVETLRRLQAEAAAELDALLPSIMDRAFKNEL